MWLLYIDHPGQNYEKPALSTLHSQPICLPGCKSFAPNRSLGCFLNMPCIFPPQHICPQHLPQWNVLPTSFHLARSASFHLYSTPTAGQHWASTFTCVISSCKAQHKFLLICEASRAIPTGSDHFPLSLKLIVCSTHLALNTS